MNRRCFLVNREQILACITRYYYVIINIGVLCILVARQPHVLLNATLFKEDGFIFFKHAYESPLISSLSCAYAGYIHVLPRIVAKACGILPLDWIPTAYVVVSLLFASVVITFFYSSLFQHVVRSRKVRALAVLCMALMPMGDDPVTINRMQGYGLLFGCLLSVAVLPKLLIGRIGLFSLFSLYVWSTPSLVVTIPVVIIRCIYAKDRVNRALWAFGLLMLVAYMVICLGGASDARAGFRIIHVIALMNAFVFRVLCVYLFGTDVGVALLNGGWVAIWLLTLLGLASVSSVIRKSFERCPIHNIWPLYYAVSITSLLFLRPIWLNNFLVISCETWSWHGRYFVVPLFMLCIFGTVVYESHLKYADPWSKNGGKRIGTVLMIWMTLHALRFKELRWTPASCWRDDAALILSYENRTTNDTNTVWLEASPKEAWRFPLVIKGKRKE